MHPPFYGKGRLSLANANYSNSALCHTIWERWRAAGHHVYVVVKPDGEIHSDLINALPTERTN